MSGKQPTLHDVARLAQVSHQTVSRVINNSPNVAEETRLKVMAAIRSLNYRPNRAARSLITGHSQTLQVIDFDAYYVTPLPPIISVASQHGYHIGVSTLRDPDSLDELRRLFDDLSSRIVDGFLLFAMKATLEAPLLDGLCRGTPYVQLGGNPAVDIPAIVFDQRHGMQQVMEHLIQKGHRKIAEVTGNLTHHDGQVRHTIYIESMLSHHLEPGPWLEGDFTVQSGYEQTSRLLEKKQPFTALVCGNDEMALGAMRALHEAGYQVPQDVSLVGFDDHMLVGYFDPPLTTVRQDYQQLARLGIEYLMRLIEYPDTPRTLQVICPELVVRQSTGKPRG